MSHGFCLRPEIPEIILRRFAKLHPVELPDFRIVMHRQQPVLP